MTAKSLKHKFQSAVADVADATLVKPSQWNDDHDLWLGYRSVTGTTDTIAQTDHLALVSYSNATGVAVSLPAPSGSNFALGWTAKLRNIGAGNVTLTPASTINGSATAIVLAQGESIELYGTGASDYAGVLTRVPTGISTVIRYDILQSLSSAQQAIALQNIGAAQLNLINGKIAESHASNAATFAIKTLGGGNPSSTDPVGVIFPDASVLWITAALSITIASGATFNWTANTGSRLWFAIINNGGTPVLAVRYCISGAWGPSGFDARGVTTATIAGATMNNGVTYGSAAVSTASPYRVIGFADYESGLATPGTWAVSPTRITLSSPNSPLPGQIVQEIFGQNFTQFSTTNATFTATNMTAAITPFSPCNPIRVRMNAPAQYQNGSSASQYMSYRFYRTSGTAGQVGPTGFAAFAFYGSQYVTDSCSLETIDGPQPAGAVNYRVEILATSGAGFMPWGTGGSMSASELMG